MQTQDGERWVGVGNPRERCAKGWVHHERLESFDDEAGFVEVDDAGGRQARTQLWADGVVSSRVAEIDLETGPPR